MTANPLDQEFNAFCVAQSRLEQGDGSLLVHSTNPLRRYIDPARLQARLDRFQQLPFPAASVQYLRGTKAFTEELLAALTIPLPPVKVLSKDENIRVRVSGPLFQLVLWEHHISGQYHELFAKGIIQEHDLLEDALINEAIRRLQTKGDLIRSCGVRFVESGSSFRPHFGWYSAILPTLLGDMPDQLLGTTNVLAAMSYGLSPLTLTPEFSGGPMGIHTDGIMDYPTSVQKVAEVLDATPGILAITGARAYEMAHLDSHFGDRLVFGWGADLTADMGPVGTRLPLSFDTEGLISVALA